MGNKEYIAEFLIATIAILFFMATFVYAAGPNGATVTPGSPQSSTNNDTAGNNSAMAGNITFLDISGFSTTQSWQGYYGNVTGAIELADSNGNSMYNWTLASPAGEIYASVNDSIVWANIQCFNFTANQSFGTGGETGGSTNLAGMNLSGLENLYNINTTSSDGVDTTFSSNNHDQFFTANKEFSANECKSIQLYGSSGSATDGQFEEVLLYEPSTVSVVFTSILESGDVDGFNGQDNDFELLVLEDGHYNNIATTAYYFFVELE